MKKTIGLILCIAMAVSMFAMTAAFAEESDEIKPASSPSSQSYIVTDSSGNTYGLLGYVTFAGNKGTVYTSYAIYSYKENEEDANERKKYLNSFASVTYGPLGLQTGTLGGEGNVVKTGKEGVVRYDVPFDGSITQILGNHGFECNGAAKLWATKLP